VIFVVGAAGFIGSHLVRELKKQGHAVRCLARSEEKASRFVEQGFEARVGDITDQDSLRKALDGVHTVVNLAGIIAERTGQSFEAIHVQGTENLLAESAQAGVQHFFYQSALGAALSSNARYHTTKAQAEEAVKSSGIPCTIFRPSLVVGPGDGFTTKVKDIISAPGPVIPVPGKGEARFQPIFVDDLVKCFLSILQDPEALGRTYELGGPEHLSYNHLVQDIAAAMGVEKKLVHIPMGLAALGTWILSKTPYSPATPEQLMLLDTDNICDKDTVKRNFGFDPLPFREALRRFISPREPGR
jgi:NADH dehydrogenase